MCGEVWRGVERLRELWRGVETLWRVVISSDMIRRKSKNSCEGRGCNCLKVDQAAMAGPHLSALGLQATTVEEHGLYPALLKKFFCDTNNIC